MAVLMLQGLVTGTLVVLAGAAVAHALARAGRPARFAWAGALVLALLVPALRALHDRHTSMPNTAGVAPADAVAALVRLAPIIVGPRPALDRPLVALWAAGSVLMLVWLAGGAYWLARQQRRWRPATVDGAVVRLAPSTGPAVVGWRRATIVLPPWALALPDSARALLLAHERAHVAARDPLLLAAATLAVAVAPWHPALWWALAGLRAAVELDCDGRVLRTAAATPERRRAYAALLLEVGERMLAAPRLPPGAVAFGHTPSLLARRITTMTSPRPRPSTARLGVTLAAAAALLAAAAALPGAHIAAGAQPPAGRPQPAGPKVKHSGEFFEFHVEQPATLVPGTLRLVWPAGLPRDTTGRAVVQFVVDTMGRMLPGSAKVLQTTGSAFGAAAAAAVSDTTVRFTPARVGGRPVRQLLQIPIEFRPEASTAGRAAPPPR